MELCVSLCVNGALVCTPPSQHGSPPPCRRSYHLSEVPPLPEEEKHTLLENMEAEPTSGTSE